MLSAWAVGVEEEGGVRARRGERGEGDAFHRPAFGVLVWGVGGGEILCEEWRQLLLLLL